MSCPYDSILDLVYDGKSIPGFVLSLSAIEGTSGYNKKEFPLKDQVNWIYIYFYDMYDVSEMNMDFKLRCYVGLKWYDPRLQVCGHEFGNRKPVIWITRLELSFYRLGVQIAVQSF